MFLCWKEKHIHTQNYTHTHKRIVPNWQVIISSEKRVGYGKRERSRGTSALFV